MPPDCSEWLALRFSAKGLPATARHARELAPWLESLSTLPSRLAEQNVSMDDLLAFLGTETVVLGGHGNADSRCLCFAPTDRSGLEAVLRKMSDTGKEPVPPAEDKTEDVKTGESKTEKGAVEDGQADQVLDELLETVADDARYVVDLRGGKIHVALKDSLLLVTPRAQDLDRILRQLDSGMADPAVEKAFDQPAAWLLGKLDTSAWLRARDKGGKRGLEAPARHLRPIEYRGSHASGILEVTAEGETGTAHLLAGALERTLPAIRNTFERIELATIVKRAKTLAEAQKTYMKLVMRDSDKDGIGEAGEAGNLLSEGLLADSEAFQQLSAEVLAGKTYSYRILIPGAVDGAESHYFVLAWPTDSEGPSILLSDSGEVRVNRSVASLDADYGPNLFQLFEGEPFRSSLRSEWIVSGMAASKESTPEAPAVATPSPVSETPVKPEKPSLDESIAILDAARQSKDMDTIRPYLENENTILQARATHYIGDLKDRKSVPLLVRLLKESVDPEVRRRAIRALALIRDPRGQSSLIEALSDSDATVRLFAATGLIGSKDPAAKEGLLGLIATHTDDSKGDRTQAVLALHDMKDPTCLRSLFTVDEGTPHFQQALVYAFQNLSPELEPEEETKLLIAALGCPNRALRAYAIQRLSESTRTEAVSALNDRLAEEGDELRPMLTRAIES
ncbi:MAG: HEAT repeat domain-containing protein, partial [Planctomycetota bacterium]